MTHCRDLCHPTVLWWKWYISDTKENHASVDILPRNDKSSIVIDVDSVAAIDEKLHPVELQKVFSSSKFRILHSAIFAIIQFNNSATSNRLVCFEWWWRKVNAPSVDTAKTWSPFKFSFFLDRSLTKWGINTAENAEVAKLFVLVELSLWL